MDGTLILTISVAALVYGVVAYIFLPMAWRHHEHQPGLAQRPMVTQTKQGIPGDPLNVGLVGEHDTIILAMNDAGWFPADPVTVTSSVKIVGSVLLKRPYEHAPVSPLFMPGGSRIWPSKNPPARAPTAVTMSVSGR